MRGLDYRAPKLGITLINAASFVNKRESLQGQDRVGRFGDACTRVYIESIPLINKGLEAKYNASLYKLLEEWNAADKLTIKMPGSSKVVNDKIKEKIVKIVPSAAVVASRSSTRLKMDAGYQPQIPFTFNRTS